MAKKSSNGLTKAAIVGAAATLIPSPLTAAVAVATAIKHKDEIKDELLDIYDKKEGIDQQHLKEKTHKMKIKHTQVGGASHTEIEIERKKTYK